ncbi:MAG: NAD(P)-dependent oxidoreductase, partial [Microbacterium sp.]
GKTIGLQGFGAIAQHVARRLSGFDVANRASDPYGDERDAASLGVELVTLDDAVRDADIVSVHVPHLPATHHLVDDALIARMRDGVVLINTSRGGTVDEAALLRGLESGRIAGAGLDVFETEPSDPRNPLFAHESVVTSPHAAADTREAYERIGWATARAIVDVFSGRRPDDIAN